MVYDALSGGEKHTNTNKSRDWMKFPVLHASVEEEQIIVHSERGQGGCMRLPTARVLHERGAPRPVGETICKAAGWLT